MHDGGAEQGGDQISLLLSDPFVLILDDVFVLLLYDVLVIVIPKRATVFDSFFSFFFLLAVAYFDGVLCFTVNRLLSYF